MINSDLWISSVPTALFPLGSLLWFWLDEAAAGITAVVFGMEKILIF